MWFRGLGVQGLGIFNRAAGLCVGLSCPLFLWWLTAERERERESDNETGLRMFG